MPEQLLTAPSGECIHVDEAKNDRRIDFDADDAKLRSLIAAARQAAESKTRRQLLHARWQLTLDAFPAPGCPAYAPSGAAVGIPPYAIRLPHSPLVAVESIQYLDMDGSWKTMPEADYVVNHDLAPAIVAPGFGKSWPIPLPQIGSVKVVYTSGYASPIVVGGSFPTAEFRVRGPVTWSVGDRVNFYNSGGALPAPLDADAFYTIASAAGGVYTLTDETGAGVSFTDAGAGRTFIGVVPEGIRSWMLLRVGSLYESREEVALLERGSMVHLPFVDGLLDPFCTGVI